MARVTVLIDVVTAGGRRQSGCCPDLSAEMDRRIRGERRKPAGHQGWREDWLSGQSADTRAYRFRSFADRRARQDPQGAAASAASPQTDYGDAGHDDRGDSGMVPEDCAEAAGEEILIRVADGDGDGDGCRVRWLHVRL